MSTRNWIAPDDTASLSRLYSSCRRSLERLAFWVAVLFPVFYLPLVVAAAVGVIHPLIVFNVIAVHVVALVIGHRHAPAADLRS
jgi:hypothetical protein